MHTVMICGVPQKGYGISWPFSIPRRALLHGDSYRTTCGYKCSAAWIIHHTPRNEKEFLRSYTPLNDIKQISLAISFCNEKRETIFITSKWSTHGYIKTGRSACHWTSKCTFMSSNKSRVQRSARSNRWATGLSSRLPPGHDRVQEKVLHGTINILSKSVFVSNKI